MWLCAKVLYGLLFWSICEMRPKTSASCGRFLRECDGEYLRKGHCDCRYHTICGRFAVVFYQDWQRRRRISPIWSLLGVFLLVRQVVLRAVHRQSLSELRGLSFAMFLPREPLSI